MHQLHLAKRLEASLLWQKILLGDKEQTNLFLVNEATKDPANKAGVGSAGKQWH